MSGHEYSLNWVKLLMVLRTYAPLNTRASLQSPGSREYPIAVVIPTYNRAATLISCLEHLERQSWTDFEVVVVDDGSHDATSQKLQED